MKKQVSSNHYDFSRYGYIGRFVSYHYQLREVIALEPKTVLEVGVGDGVFRYYIRTHTDISYKALDIADDLHPDIVAEITNIPCDENEFDVVCCFEVLEHLPYDEVPKALAELTRVAKRAVVLSVPHFGPRFQFFLKLPFLPEIKLAMKVPWPKRHVFNGQHYWELGKKGYSQKSFSALLSQHGTVARDFVPFEYQYHHFYIIRLDRAIEAKAK